MCPLLLRIARRNRGKTSVLAARDECRDAIVTAAIPATPLSAVTRGPEALRHHLAVVLPLNRNVVSYSLEKN